MFKRRDLPRITSINMVGLLSVMFVLLFAMMVPSG